MPNHVHLLILPQVALPKITQWIKGRTAREANRWLGRAGAPFWQMETGGSQKELHRIAAYIEENPVSAGLAATPEDWLWSSATRAGKLKHAPPLHLPQNAYTADLNAR